MEDERDITTLFAQRIPLGKNWGQINTGYMSLQSNTSRFTQPFVENTEMGTPISIHLYIRTCLLHRITFCFCCKAKEEKYGIDSFQNLYHIIILTQLYIKINVS